MNDTNEPRLVKALYNYKGANNDELNFSRGDIITVTQVIEGGWWEGTLDATTGWFPSNYVKDVKPDGRPGAMSPIMDNQPGEALPLTKRESMLFYRSVVLQSLYDTERTFVNEIQTLVKLYLKPLHSANVLVPHEYAQLVGNMEELISLHQQLLLTLDENSKLAVMQQRIGGVFMQMAPQMKSIYSEYCANHPKAAIILQKRKEELTDFMDAQGAPTSTGIHILTTSFSKPFTRLDKYPSHLKELERHTDGSHIDRGDTQRAISVYKDISTSCNELRKQKELELDVLSSSIKDWDGEERDISTLGEVILLSHVHVHSENGERKEQLMLLYPGNLVMLSISPRLSGYLYEGKFPVSGMTVNSLDEDEDSNAFEITGSLIDRRVVLCASHSERSRWVETLRQEATLVHNHISSKPQSLDMLVPASQAAVSHMTKAKTAQLLNHHTAASLGGVGGRLKPYSSAWCIRPRPPVKPSTQLHRDDPLRSPRSSRKGSNHRRKPVDDAKTLEDDAVLLKVIEAYCTSAKTRQTVNSSLFDSPHMLIAEEEKIIIEEIHGDQTVFEEKTLVDTIYTMKDDVKELREEQNNLRRELEEERRARRKLETLLAKSLQQFVDVNSNEETPA